MTIETMYLINTIARSVCSGSTVIYLTLIIPATMIGMGTVLDLCEWTRVKRMAKVVSVVAAITFGTSTISEIIKNYTQPFAEVYRLQIKGEAVHEGLKAVDYDAILGFIKEARK